MCHIYCIPTFRATGDRVRSLVIWEKCLKWLWHLFWLPSLIAHWKHFVSRLAWHSTSKARVGVLGKGSQEIIIVFSKAGCGKGKEEYKCHTYMSQAPLAGVVLLLIRYHSLCCCPLPHFPFTGKCCPLLRQLLAKAPADHNIGGLYVKVSSQMGHWMNGKPNDDCHFFFVAYLSSWSWFFFHVLWRLVSKL